MIPNETEIVVVVGRVQETVIETETAAEEDRHHVITIADRDVVHRLADITRVTIEIDAIITRVDVRITIPAIDTDTRIDVVARKDTVDATRRKLEPDEAGLEAVRAEAEVDKKAEIEIVVNRARVEVDLIAQEEDLHLLIRLLLHRHQHHRHHRDPRDLRQNLQKIKI